MGQELFWSLFDTLFTYLNMRYDTNFDRLRDFQNDRTTDLSVCVCVESARQLQVQLEIDRDRLKFILLPEVQPISLSETKLEDLCTIIVEK